MRVVDRLETVEVDEQQRQRPAAARRTLGLAPQDLIEVARVVQVREVVGHRERLGALEQPRVVERDGRRLEQHANRLQERRREPRLARRRLPIERDQGADPPPAAAEDQRDRRASRRARDASVAAEIRGGEVLAAVHHPARDREHSRPHGGRDPVAGENLQLSGGCGRDNGRHGRRQPRLRALDDQLRDLRRLQRRVDGANDVDERVAPLDPAAQRALKRPETRRQIEPGRRQRDVARAARFGSTFSGRPHGVIQRDRHPRRSTGGCHPKSF